MSAQALCLQLLDSLTAQVSIGCITSWDSTSTTALQGCCLQIRILDMTMERWMRTQVVDDAVDEGASLTHSWQPVSVCSRHMYYTGLVEEQGDHVC